jgi:hypothetical protein
VQEVELLRPGTVIPSPTTVSRDVTKIYKEGAKQVKEYFKVLVTFCTLKVLRLSLTKF